MRWRSRPIIAMSAHSGHSHHHHHHHGAVFISANEEGKSQYACGKYDEAIAAFSTAIDTADSAVESAQAYSNRAAAQLQCRRYELTIADCTRALELDPGSVKAQLRRALALREVEQFARAWQDADAVLRVTAPGSPLHRLAAETRNGAAAMLGRPQEPVAPELLNEHHSLRLYLRASPAPPRVGAAFEVRCYIANEFGLFAPARSDVRGLRLHATVVKLVAAADAAPLALWFDGDDAEVPANGRVVMTGALAWRRGSGGAAAAAAAGELATPYLMRFCLRRPDGAECGNIMPVVSIPLAVEAADEEGVGADAGAVCPVTGGWASRLVECEDRTVVPVLLLETLDLGIPGKIWDAGLVMCQLFARNVGVVRGRRVLELGAGTGLVGLCAWRLGAAHVTLTDLPDVCRLMADTLVANARCAPSGADATASVAPLAWGTADADAFVGSFDVLIMADVVYEPRFYAALLDTCLKLVPEGSPIEIWWGFRMRHEDNMECIESFRRHFELAVVPRDGDFCSNVTVYRCRRIRGSPVVVAAESKE